MTAESDKDSLSKFPDLEYGRDLFVQLFHTETPLINLGYKSSQREIAKPVLRLMESEGRVRLKPLEVYFGESGEATVVLQKLRNGGYYMYADRGGHPSFMQMITSKGFFDNEFLTIVARVNMLSGNQDYCDINTLVTHLYEGQITDRPIHMEPRNPLSQLKSALLPNTAIYKAAWTDEETKLELVIESNFVDKALADGDSQPEIEIWRRLSTQNLEGQKWVPWGKKPNISEDRLKKILEAKKAKVVVGQLVFGESTV